MKLSILFIIALSIHLASSAPDRLQTLEAAMLNQLHRPLFPPDRPPEHPRKGEGCNGGRCKPDHGCDGCQHAVPVFNKERFEFIKD